MPMKNYDFKYIEWTRVIHTITLGLRFVIDLLCIRLGG